MDENAKAETGWNLYRAIRTYAVIQSRLQNAREDLGEDPSIRRGAVAHARYIVATHALDTPAMQRSIGDEGIDCLTRALAFEIERAEMPSTRDTIQNRWLPDAQVVAIRSFVGEIQLEADTYRLDASISINPLMFADEASFLAAMKRELPILYCRVRQQVDKYWEHKDNAELVAQEEWDEIAEEVQAKVDQAVKDHGRGVMNPPGSFDEALEYQETHDGRVQRNPRSGLTPPEWDFFWRNMMLGKDGECVYTTAYERHSAPQRELLALHEGRARLFRALEKHARWWSQVKHDHRIVEDIASHENVAAKTITQALEGLEGRYIRAPHRLRPPNTPP